ncbi:hypothetical protein WISP_150648 [Willisornis vidua]|uniref:Uncharacterized protein n=1 Tax=Willisornis vidua TaxID=1566151 RepID=A0ABQ9CNS0_9PASS|nr:hypothetical protein WISP_150648 [Willisornis vidua]
MGKKVGGDMRGELTPTDQGDIPYHITESQNMPSWKGPTRIIKSNPQPCTRTISKTHTMCLRISSKHFLNFDKLGHSPGEPVPEPNHPLGEEPFSNIQPKPLLTQLQAIASNPVTGHHREEISVCPSSSTHKEVLTAMRSPLSVLQAEQAKCPQLLLIQLPLKALHHLHCPLLDTL